MNPALQLLKTGRLAPGVERDDLAVEDDRLLQPARPLLQRAHDFGELAGFFVPQPRPEPHVRGTGYGTGTRPLYHNPSP